MSGDCTYSGYGSIQTNAGITTAWNFELLSPGRRIQIKSILLDWQCLDPATGNKIIWRDNPGVYMIFVIGDFGLTASQLTKPFRRTGGAPFLFNGNVIWITEPKQVFFDSFYISNVIPFSFQVCNNTANPLTNAVTVVIETNEQAVY